MPAIQQAIGRKTGLRPALGKKHETLHEKITKAKIG
jgi:hypothetical protein